MGELTTIQRQIDRHRMKIIQKYNFQVRVRAWYITTKQELILISNRHRTMEEIGQSNEV